jgi:hypothetical protein
MLNAKCKKCGLEMVLDTGDTPLGEEASEALAEVAGVDETDPLCYGCIGALVRRSSEELAAAEAAFREELDRHAPGNTDLSKRAEALRAAQARALALAPWNSR